MDKERTLESLKLFVYELMKDHDISGHGYSHCITVLKHAKLALEDIKYKDLDENIKLAIMCAALLHDVDDYKLFTSKIKNENAINFLNRVTNNSNFINLILEMIDLVSCSKNRNKLIEPKWKLIPRDCDRLEALGKIGILRCYQYTIIQNRPLFTVNTKRVTTVEELNKVATNERFLNYKGNSISMIDHYYDKLLHIHIMASDNEYINKKAEKRYKCMLDFIFYFGKTGEIDIKKIEKYTKS